MSSTGPWVTHLPYEALKWIGDAHAALKPKGQWPIVLVSITEKSWKAEVPKGVFDEVIRLAFSALDPLRIHWANVPEGEKNAFDFFSMSQAEALADFLLQHRGKNIVVHCAAGISRSAAVAEVVLETFGEYVDRGDAARRHANGHVKALLRVALAERMEEEIPWAREDVRAGA